MTQIIYGNEISFVGKINNESIEIVSSEIIWTKSVPSIQLHGTKGVYNYVLNFASPVHLKGKRKFSLTVKQYYKKKYLTTYESTLTAIIKEPKSNKLLRYCLINTALKNKNKNKKNIILNGIFYWNIKEIKFKTIKGMLIVYFNNIRLSKGNVEIKRSSDSYRVSQFFNMNSGERLNFTMKMPHLKKGLYKTKNLYFQVIHFSTFQGSLMTQFFQQKKSQLRIYKINNRLKIDFNAALKSSRKGGLLKGIFLENK